MNRCNRFLSPCVLRNRWSIQRFLRYRDVPPFYEHASVWKMTKSKNHIFCFWCSDKSGMDLFRASLKIPGRSLAALVLLSPIPVLAAAPAVIADTDIRLQAGVNGPEATIGGTLNGDPGSGVVVNGRAVSIVGGRFLTKVPLRTGSNTVSLRTTTPEGATVQSTMTVHAAAETSPFSVSASPDQGVAPLPVEFDFALQSGTTFAELRADYDGDGTTDLTTTDPDAALSFTYTAAGTYTASFTLKDAAAAESTYTVPITVNSVAELDAVIRNQWKGFKDALKIKDTAAAQNFLTKSARDHYGAALNTLLDDLPAIEATFSLLRRVSVSGEFAEYAINRSINGENRLFLINFVQDVDGVWRVDGM